METERRGDSPSNMTMPSPGSLKTWNTGLHVASSKVVIRLFMSSRYVCRPVPEVIHSVVEGKSKGSVIFSEVNVEGDQLVLQTFVWATKVCVMRFLT